MSARVNLQYGEATFSPLGRRWGGGAHGGPIVRFTAKRKSPFDASIQIEMTASGGGAHGCCSPEQLEKFARELQRLLIQTRAPPAVGAFFDPPPANDDGEAFFTSPAPQESFLAGVRTLFARRSGALRELFADPPDESPAPAVLDGVIDGTGRRVIHVALGETPATRILRVELRVGDPLVQVFSNPQAIRAFLEDLRESGLLGA